MTWLRALSALALIVGVTACGSSPTMTSKSVVLAMFHDTVSGISTPDVRDVDRQVVNFDTNNNTLIWTSGNLTFPGYTVSGDNINGTFQVRFGMENGERRAYFTETARAFLCNVEVVNGQLSITPTDVPVPGGS
jgi:hypothetical protein